jgi:bloom syndrome protein
MAIQDFADCISNGIKERNIYYPITIIFCHTYNDCNLVYDEVEQALGAFITYPSGYPKIQKYCLVD